MRTEAHVRVDEHGHEQLSEAFWLSHIRVGFGVLVAESLAIFVYLLATPEGSHRFALAAIAASSAAVGAVAFFALRWISRQPWRAGFSLAWSLGCGWALAAVAHLDGGVDSPLLYLVLFPVIYAALAYRPVATVACGVSALVQLLVISSNDADVMLPRANLFMIAAVIVGMSALAVAASTYRDKLQRNEKGLRRDLAALADTDGLTGCLNHRAFHEQLAVEIDRAVRAHQPLSLIVIDIDNFKSVNDTYGHPAGDMALVAVARALRRELRSVDVIGRVGGDEFAILATDTPLAGAATHARRISRTLERECSPSVGLSIGMAELDLTEPGAAQLLAEADRALYHVKGTGRRGIAATSSDGILARLAG